MDRFTPCLMFSLLLAHIVVLKIFPAIHADVPAQRVPRGQGQGQRQEGPARHHPEGRNSEGMHHSCLPWSVLPWVVPPHPNLKFIRLGLCWHTWRCWKNAPMDRRPYGGSPPNVCPLMFAHRCYAQILEDHSEHGYTSDAVPLHTKTHHNPITVRETDKATNAYRIFRNLGLRHLIVVDASFDVVGEWALYPMLWLRTHPRLWAGKSGFGWGLLALLVLVYYIRWGRLWVRPDPDGVFQLLMFLVAKADPYTLTCSCFFHS